MRRPNGVRRELLVATSTFNLLQTGASIQLHRIPWLEWRSVVFLAEAPEFVPARRRMNQNRCDLSCHIFKVLLEVQHPVQAHAKVLWSLLKHQALAIGKHVQFPFSFSVIEMIGDRHCLAYTKLYASFPKVFYQDGNVFVETLFHSLPRWFSQ